MSPSRCRMRDMIRRLRLVAVWTVCTLVASYGCRCGTLHPDRQPSGMTPASGSPSPALSEAASRRERLDAIKSDILGKLGLDAAPDVERLAAAGNNASSAEERRRALDAYEQSVDQLRGKSHRLTSEEWPRHRAKQFYVFKAASTSNSGQGRSASDGRRYFHIRFDVDLPTPQDAGKEIVVKSATLRLYRRRVGRRKQRLQVGSLRVNVYQLLPVSNSSTSADRKRLVDSLIVDCADSNRTWVEFDVAKAVRDWSRDRSTNLGLVLGVDVLESSRTGSRPRLRLNSVLELAFSRDANATAASTNASDARSSPTLSVLTRQRSTRRAARRRTRREAERTDCERGDGETRCCRYPLWVSFSEIGWDQWIVAPSGYQAYYCDGTCPPQHRVAHPYVGIQTLVHGARPDAAPTPCCAATRLSPLTLAHLDGAGRTLVSVFDDMIVEECKCT